MVIVRFFSRIICLAIGLALLGQHALADGKRVALVIGNAAYKHAAELRNPRNDAQDVADALEKLGFTVISGFDLDHAGIRRSVGRFAVALEHATVAVFYYAGHGIQIGGTNFLVPIDSKLENQYSPEFELIRIDTVQRLMESKRRTNIIFLDACRDNPLARNLARAMGTRSTSITQGLSPSESGIGTLISYSTQPGAVAQDGNGRNSPYAGALVRQLGRPGVALTDMLLDVRREVMLATRDQQIPWEHSALRDRFYFAPPRPAPVVVAPPPPAEPAELTPAQKSALARRLNRELKRVGCDPGTSAGTWTAASQDALQRFAIATKHALYTDEPTQAALDALKVQKFIVCSQPAVVNPAPTPADKSNPANGALPPKIDAAPRIEQGPKQSAHPETPATAAAPPAHQQSSAPASSPSPPALERRPTRPRPVPKAAAVKPPRAASPPPDAASPSFATKVERQKKCRPETVDECVARTGLPRSIAFGQCPTREICR